MYLLELRAMDAYINKLVGISIVHYQILGVHWNSQQRPL